MPPAIRRVSSSRCLPQRREDALLHFVHRTHAVYRAHDAADLVVTSEQRGLVLVLGEALPEGAGLFARPPLELRPILVADARLAGRRAPSVGGLALGAGRAAGGAPAHPSPRHSQQDDMVDLAPPPLQHL